MIHKIWKDLLGEEGLLVSSEDEIEKIIKDLVIPDRIDPKLFINNYELLLSGGNKSIRDMFFGKDEKQVPTPSLNYFTKPGHKAPAFPLWFYAAYPDAMVWFHEWQKEYLRFHDYDDNTMALETAKLFGIDINDKTIDKNQVKDEKGYYLSTLLKNLVRAYRDASKVVEVETAVKI